MIKIQKSFGMLQKCCALDNKIGNFTKINAKSDTVIPKMNHVRTASV